jgi:hypothetical protein
MAPNNPVIPLAELILLIPVTVTVELSKTPAAIAITTMEMIIIRIA